MYVEFVFQLEGVIVVVVWQYLFDGELFLLWELFVDEIVDECFVECQSCYGFGVCGYLCLVLRLCFLVFVRNRMVQMMRYLSVCEVLEKFVLLVLVGRFRCCQVVMIIVLVSMMVVGCVKRLSVMSMLLIDLVRVVSRFQMSGVKVMLKSVMMLLSCFQSFGLLLILFQLWKVNMLILKFRCRMRSVMLVWFCVFLFIG